MAVWIEADESKPTQDLLADVLSAGGLDGTRVQFLVPAGSAGRKVQAMRVALSRSRARNKKRGRGFKEFTLKHECYPFTDRSGKRFDCIVMWVEIRRYHRLKEILTDTLKD